MARATTLYICQNCGASHSKWVGQCEACRSWNCVTEELAPTSAPKSLGAAKGRTVLLEPLQGDHERKPRLNSGIVEFDRACGGGLVAGSAILIGGDPGIGKSTLVLQVLAQMAQKGASCVYLSGEEAVEQIRLRASRLKCLESPVQLAAETNVRDILTTLAKAPPQLLVVDSIQTMYTDILDSAPGSVAQVRASAQEFIRFGKKTGTIVMLVGHVTKEGQIAGPRVLEHMVDTVLYFEGERGHQFRIIRAVKNRFGPADEIGVFEMTDGGLAEVPNPSALFLGERGERAPGTAVFAGIEGTRPVLVEIQALVAPSYLASPRRTVVGWDANRLAMITAVMDTRCNTSFASHDIYLNVAGGLRVNEPAADLAVAAALISSITGTNSPENTVFFGEVSLSGEVRMVSRTETRLREAGKLGFDTGITPPLKADLKYSIKVNEINKLSDLFKFYN